MRLMFGTVHHVKFCAHWNAYMYYLLEAKQKYRGIFETQKSGNKTSSGEIGLDIRTHASPKVGQDQIPGGVSLLCWHAAPVANVLLKTFLKKTVANAVEC